MKKIIAIVLVSMMLVASLAGCGEKETSTEGSGEGLTKVVISEFRGLGWASVYVAYQNGYFQEEGLEPEFALYDDGPIAFQGMHGGDSQFCLLSQEPVLKAEQEGLRSSIIYTVLDTRLYGFVTSQEIKDVKDLKGQAIFAGFPGSAPYSFVSAILREGGLDPEKDVTFVTMDYSASMSALDRGEIKASYMNVDNRVDIKNMDVNIIVDTSRPEDAAKYLKTDIFPGEIITTTADYAQNNPEAVQSFVNAVQKGAQWMNEHSSAEVAAVIAPLFEGMSEDILSQRIEIFKSAYTKTGYISDEAQTAVEDFCMQTGVITDEIPYDQIINMSFVDNVK